MAPKVGRRFVLRGSLAQTVLSYAVSEPGYWTVNDIVEDIDQEKSTVIENVRSLQRRKLISRQEERIYPTENGRIALFRSMRVLVG